MLTLTKLLFLLVLAVLVFITPTALIDLLSPVVVIFVTWLVRLAKPKIPGWAVLGIATFFGSLAAWLITQVDPSASWFSQFAIAMLAVLIVEFKTQLQQGNDNSPAFNAKLKK